MADPTPAAQGSSGAPTEGHSGAPEGRSDGPGRQPGVREVLLVAVVVVGLVLAAAALTAILPPDAQALVFHTPLLIAVLVLGTALVLWRILRAPSTRGPRHD